ncbi:hypothetical protein Tco_1073320, partial [Tanacetum coccineum]
MLVENKYPLKKEVLSQLLKLKLETEEDSTMALELIRFVKKQIAELESKDSDGDEEDCNTPKMGRSGIRIRGVLLQDQHHKIY